MDSTLPSQPFSSPIYLNAFSKSHAVFMNWYFLKITRERREGGGGRGERGKRWEAENLLAGHLDLGSGTSSVWNNFLPTFPQTSFRGKTNRDFPNCRLFSQDAFHLLELTCQTIPVVMNFTFIIIIIIIIIMIINLYLYMKSYHFYMVFLGIVWKIKLKYSKELLDYKVKNTKTLFSCNESWCIKTIFPMKWSFKTFKLRWAGF